MIAGLETISEGSLLIDGVLANDLKPKDRNLTMVFQNYALYPHMTVKDNILFGLDIKGVSPSEQALRLRNTSELVGLTKYLDRNPGQLSGGQRQKVLLARALCATRECLVLDEPSNNLDYDSKEEFYTVLKELHQKGLTIIMITHDLASHEVIGNKILHLDKNNYRMEEVK